MPRRKPPGWPKLLVARRLRSGKVGFYWVPPSWAAKKGCPVPSAPLGMDFSEAKRKADQVYNPQYDAWLGGRECRPAQGPVQGTFDWLAALYRSSPKFTDLAPGTRQDYEAVLRLISEVKLKDGRLFGTVALGSVTPGAADRLHAQLKRKPDGTDRVRTATLAMAVARRAWNIGRRDKPNDVPVNNPFAQMGLSYAPKPTRPVNYGELLAFTAAAGAAGANSISTAALIAFFWLQRQEDILARLSWTHYRPADAPNNVRIFHHKTGELVDLPLYDVDGTALYPQLTQRLDDMPRRGTLIVTRDEPDRRRKVHLPWAADYFRHRFAEIRKNAAIPDEVTFMGLRHGGNVEGAEAELTDAQLRALSGHKTTAALLRYAQATQKQRQQGARKRLDARTKQEVVLKQRTGLVSK